MECLSEQLALHPDLCGLPFSRKGTCDVTCHRCTPCPDPEGPKYCQANIQVQPFIKLPEGIQAYSHTLALC